MTSPAGRSNASLAPMRVHQLTLTTPKIIALGALTSKRVEVPTPPGYRLFMIRSMRNNLFTFTDDLAGMAKLVAFADFDGDAVDAALPIDTVFGPGGLPVHSGKLFSEVYLGRDVNPAISASTGFTIQSIDTTDDSAGPTFATLNPAVLGNVVLEIHFLLATLKEVSL